MEVFDELPESERDENPWPPELPHPISPYVSVRAKGRFRRTAGSSREIGWSTIALRVTPSIIAASGRPNSLM